METVTATRELDAPADAVRETLADPETFLDGVGFEVDRDGDVLTLARRIAVTRIELRVRLVDGDAALAYEQVEGIFGRMRTRYDVDETDGGCRVTVETAFEPPESGFGTFVNGPLVRRLRGTELAELEALVDDRRTAAESPPGGDVDAGTVPE